MIYELWIDIEAVTPNDDCYRPVQDVILCESNDVKIVEGRYAKLQRLFPVVENEGIKAEGKIVYTVFAYKRDEEGTAGFYEENDLARFTNLKNAKKLMKEVVKTFRKIEDNENQD